MNRFLLIGFFALLMFSCSTQNSSEVNVFRYNESNGITSLDPAFSRNLENMWACNQLFDGLVQLSPSMTIEPSIAKSWEVSEDGLEYIFVLREDVFFHPDTTIGETKGRRVVAKDFVFSFNRIINPQTASPGKWVFNRVDVSNNGGFEAPHDDTLKIHLSAPFPPFLGLLTMQYCNVVSPEAVGRYGPDFRSNPIGTGPFKFAFWIEDVALVFHKNQNFYSIDSTGASLPYLDAVKISFVKDMSSEFYGLLKGEYDFMSGIHQAYKDELLTPEGELSGVYADKLKFQKTPFIKTDYLGILVDEALDLSSSSPLSDVKVRKALNYAINRKKMVKYLRNNAVYPANAGFIPRGLPSFDPKATYGYTYDVARAKELLEQAGFPNGKDMGPITISTTADYVDLCEFIQHEWAQIGVNLQIDILPGGTQREYVANSRILMFRKSWLADYADAENFMGLFYSKNYSPNGPNYTHYKDSVFDALFERAYLEPNAVGRMEMYRTMDSLVMDAAPVIPLFYDQVSHFISRDVVGLQTTPINMLDLSVVKKGIRND